MLPVVFVWLVPILLLGCCVSASIHIAVPGVHLYYACVHALYLHIQSSDRVESHHFAAGVVASGDVSGM